MEVEKNTRPFTVEKKMYPWDEVIGLALNCIITKEKKSGEFCVEK